MAVMNDFYNDFNMICKAEGIAKGDLADKAGLDQNNMARSCKRQQFAPNFVKLIEALGYDIKVSYVRRSQTAEEILKK